MNTPVAAKKSWRDFSTWAFGLLGLNILVFLILQFPNLFTERIWPDEALYAWFARQLARHPGYLFSPEFSYPPLMPILISPGNFFTPPEVGFRIMILAWSVLGMLALYRLGERLSPVTGLFAALGMSYQIISFRYATFILIDPVLTTFFVFLAQALLRAGEGGSGLARRRDVVVGLWCAGIVFLKWSSVLAAVWVSLYYLLAFDTLPFRERLRRLRVPLGFFGGAVAILALRNNLLMGRLFPSLTALRGAYHIQSFEYYFRLLRALTPPELCVFLLLGLLALIRCPRRQMVLILTWAFPSLLIISFIPEKDPRYLLPILPCFALLIGMGFHLGTAPVAAIKRVVPRAALMFCLLTMISAGFYRVIRVGLLNGAADQAQYLGFREAGAWIKRTVPDSVVIAGSDRALRLYTGINYKSLGGRLYKMPVERSGIEAILRDEDQRDIVLVIDPWEFTQPRWLFRIEGRDYLEGLGFRLVRVIPNPYQDSAHPVAAWILYRPRAAAIQKGSAVGG